MSTFSLNGDSSYILNEWLSPYDEPEIEITILIPNGLITTLTVSNKTKLFDIKEEIFDLAADLPMYGALYDKQSYVFTCVNFTTGEQEEVDEDRSIADVKPFMKILRLIERKGNIASKQLNAQIGPLIGKGLHEFDALKNPEINDFRWRVKHRCEEIARQRLEESWMNKVKYKYPVRIEPNPGIPLYLKDHLSKETIDIQIRIKSKDFIELNIFYRAKIDEIIRATLELFETEYEEDKYSLKIFGQEEYLLDNHPLICYKYVRESLANYLKPSFIIIVNSEIDVSEKIVNEPRHRSSTLHSTQTGTYRKKTKPVSSFDINEKFSITINKCIRMNHTEGVRLAVSAGLFHGGSLLVHSLSTSDVNASTDEDNNMDVVEWDEQLTFDIPLSDVPRMTRLCLVLYEIMVRARKGSGFFLVKSTIACDITTNHLKWANTPLFDYRGQLKSGSYTLPMWPYPESLDDLSGNAFNPLGTVLPNPFCAIFYPQLEAILASTPVANSSDSRKSGDHSPSSRYLEQLKSICSRDPLTEMASLDREFLWYFREDLSLYLPTALPYLLNCVDWSDHLSVCSMLRLLHRWPKLEPEMALQLLDYAYADCSVRSYAVSCLKSMSDDDLSLYLLQLVQALKYESYLHCDLAMFLLERALVNRRLGHQLFWLLRSEMAEPSVSTYFGLLLEAYCRGSIDHMKDLSRQMEAVNKLKHMNEIVKRESTRGKESKERLMTVMHEILEQSYYKESLKDVTNPLDPRIKLSTIKVDNCKLMDSKMKPLWLVFNNSDQGADDVSIIFKNGDDLRQDMLTLQMFRIMDKLWKDEGLDLRLTPYRVIATDRGVGLIQVVPSTQTLAKIQKSCSMKATSAFNKAALLNWLRSHNPTEPELTKAIRQFTLSCAGYSVATYVLGIADRHSDNILIKSNGQILHIDFGHILGKFKEKFGIRRERVPFVLTNDFVYVITAGGSRRGDFAPFQSICEQAFTILWKKGHFILSLFAMMLSTGIPELSSVKDLDYLRETLVLDLTQEEALAHFRSKFDEALKNSWKTNINWLAHNIAKDNN
ncbi:phosphatidylinositol 4,5-bisphosphate 3-kinase catalytic subunit delta isoform-like isoform X2 [Tetranychus urticae]|uniref:phosphatidylinositol 4,5-bisphosphate 3-kinase catalytic subunit delta isoform-like isoform X2 n=1 Tax=Tetranychus urticae TaxID=32264 RepID=UPI000D65A79E|nr:phosphatidylinositol 4,5-bisphosphate 3-kinase catalytic subunit delta isoform-like isoform X2 [Tetranychus urticae]